MDDHELNGAKCGVLRSYHALVHVCIATCASHVMTHLLNELVKPCSTAGNGPALKAHFLDDKLHLCIHLRRQHCEAILTGSAAERCQGV